MRRSVFVVALLTGACAMTPNPEVEAVAAAAMLCLPLPMLLWAAARFGVVGSSAAVLLFGVFAVCGALTGAGPFTAQADSHNALSVVLFLVVTCIPLLVLGAALDERRSLESARDEPEPGSGQCRDPAVAARHDVLRR